MYKVLKSYVARDLSFFFPLMTLLFSMTCQHFGVPRICCYLSMMKIFYLGGNKLNKLETALDKCLV